MRKTDICTTVALALIFAWGCFTYACYRDREIESDLNNPCQYVPTIGTAEQWAEFQKCSDAEPTDAVCDSCWHVVYGKCDPIPER